MTETPELEPARAAAQPSPSRPERRPAPPEDQPLPASAEVDYLGADGEVSAGEAFEHQNRRRVTDEPDTDRQRS